MRLPYTLPSRIMAVSYTHLDVYKRQYMPNTMAMEPPLTPGTSIVPPTIKPFRNVTIGECFIINIVSFL